MLVWPQEFISTDDEAPEWNQAGSNLCLDFHGDPSTAKLVVLSDGNHHMALQEVLQDFYKKQPEVGQIFYATTPPGPLLKLLKSGSLQIGNLVISVKPHVFLSPPAVLDSLISEGYMRRHVPFMRNQGSILLVRKGNPKNIKTIADLARPDVRLFLSNPHSESISYLGYVKTLLDMAAVKKVDLSFLMNNKPNDKVVYGECIHHREAPQAIVNSRADAAIVYYHLGLRYTRIFPSLFEMIPIDGTVEPPRPSDENVISHIHAGIIDDGGLWGKKFFSYLQLEHVKKIYTKHGLLPISNDS